MGSFRQGFETDHVDSRRDGGFAGLTGGMLRSVLPRAQPAPPASDRHKWVPHTSRRNSRTRGVCLPIRIRGTRGPTHRNEGASPADRQPGKREPTGNLFSRCGFRRARLCRRQQREPPRRRRLAFDVTRSEAEMAFFQDMRPSREPFLNAPATIFWLIGVLTAAHVARVLAPPPWPDYILFKFAFIPARYSEAALAAAGIPMPGLADQIIPFVSYMLLHGNYTHLGINSLWLLAFGPIVAKRLKTGKFLLFFVFCGIVSAAVHLAVYFGDAQPVVGASGGISGLMGAAIRIFYGRLYYRHGVAPGQTIPLAPLFSRPTIGFTFIWLVANFIAGVTGVGLTDETTTVAWVAHLGGYFAGLLAITVFDRFPARARPADLMSG